MTKSTLFFVLLALLPATAFTSQWDIQQLADELEHASNKLYRSAKAVRGFSSVGHNANRLSSKAEQLADSISRGRTSAHVRTRFTDVSRYYQRVENAFLSARRSYGTHYVDESFDYVADLFASLSYEFYGDTNYQGFRSNSQRYNSGLYNRAPLILINPSRNSSSRNHKRSNQRSPVIQRQNQRDRDRLSNNRSDSNSQHQDDNTTGSGRDNPVTQRQNQRKNDSSVRGNRKDQSRNSTSSGQGRNSAVTQQQNRSSNSGFGRAGLNNFKNRNSATATLRSNGSNVSNSVGRRGRSQ